MAKAFGATPLPGWTQGQFAAEVDELPNNPVAQQTRRLKPQDMEDFEEIHGNAFRVSKNGREIALEMFDGLLKTG